MREKLKRLAIYLLLLAFFIPGITGRRIDAQAAGDSGNDTQAAAIRISKTAATLSPKQTLTLRLNGTTRKPVWTSSNTKVATVGRTTGKVTAKKSRNGSHYSEARGKDVSMQSYCSCPNVI